MDYSEPGRFGQKSKMLYFIKKGISNAREKNLPIFIYKYSPYLYP